MKKNLKFSIISIIILAFLAIFVYNKTKCCDMSKKINIIMVGAAGSGKGTQGDLIKDKYNLLKMSAGDVLREYRNNPQNKHAEKVNEYLGKGELIPIEITNEIIENYLNNNIKNYSGVIFDGFPRHILQAEFLDSYLKKTNQSLDAVIYLEISPKDLIERLQNRYSCSKCGEIYNKISKPTKKAGICDVCGHNHFLHREDDADVNAISKRFEIFNIETSKVLEKYSTQGIVFSFDGKKDPKTISEEISKKLDEILAKKTSK